jgi:hypothetical protein
MPDREAIERAQRVERLIEDPDLEAAFARLDRHYVEELRNTGLEEEGKRNQLWHRLRALQAVHEELGVMIADGAVEVHIEQKKKKREVHFQW